MRTGLMTATLLLAALLATSALAIRTPELRGAPEVAPSQAATDAAAALLLSEEPVVPAAAGAPRALLQQRGGRNGQGDGKSGARDKSDELNELAAAGRVVRVSADRGQHLSAGTIAALCSKVGTTGGGPCKRDNGDRRRLLQLQSRFESAAAGLARALLQQGSAGNKNGQGDGTSGARAPDFNELIAAGKYVRVDTSRGGKASAGSIAAYCSQQGNSAKAPCKRNVLDK